jgi:hypothetical protein
MPESRQLDFWIGDWDLKLKAKSPTSDQWAEAKATNRIRSTLGGCVIEEDFRAEGPGSPWAGRSFSVYVPKQKRWRQTWVDDQGGYLAFTGGWADGKMTLDGEPQQREGKTIQMRMVFSDIGPDHITWTWERTEDGGKTWAPQLVIEYTRRR